METIAQYTSTAIQDIVIPTIQTYSALQAPHADKYLSGVTEHSYGSVPRQKLDVYLPSTPLSGEPAKSPCVVYLYGGGLVNGAKRMPPAKGAIYGNIGHFFAQRGFVAVVVDYRLYSASSIEDGGAKFPSGGEDIALALQWITANLQQVDGSRIFLLGNSAGGVHVATYLYAAQDTPSTQRTNVRGAIFTQVPMHFHNAHGSRKATLEGYYSDYVRECPYALRQESDDATETCIVLAERDPDDEIVRPNHDFLALWPNQVASNIPRPTLLPEVSGHNHISLPMALSLGGKEDEWADTLLQWIRDRC